jgi:hypothetical protein
VMSFSPSPRRSKMLVSSRLWRTRVTARDMAPDRSARSRAIAWVGMTADFGLLNSRAPYSALVTARSRAGSGMVASAAYSARSISVFRLRPGLLRRTSRCEPGSCSASAPIGP